MSRVGGGKALTRSGERRLEGSEKKEDCEAIEKAHGARVPRRHSFFGFSLRAQATRLPRKRSAPCSTSQRKPRDHARRPLTPAGRARPRNLAKVAFWSPTIIHDSATILGQIGRTRRSRLGALVLEIAIASRYCGSWPAMRPRVLSSGRRRQRPPPASRPACSISIERQSGAVETLHHR